MKEYRQESHYFERVVCNIAGCDESGDWLNQADYPDGYIPLDVLTPSGWKILDVPSDHTIHLCPKCWKESLR